MIDVSMEEVRSAVSGTWLQRPGTERIAGVGTDTRADLDGRAFVALRGERFDAHDHLDAAAAAGAVLLIVERAVESLPANVGVLQVDDTRRALGRLASSWRRTLRATKVVGITGSCGKTTTRRLINGALSTTLSGSSAEKSFNNEIGVPLTLLAARPSDRYLLVEMGTNAPGEISRLSAIVEPDILVLTGVGHSHLEGLGDIEAVAEEKASAIRHLRPGGAIVAHETALLDPYLRGVDGVLRYGEGAACDLRLTDRDRGFLVVNDRARFPIALPGRHNALNALAAVAVGRRFGLADETIGEGIGTVMPSEMRGETVERGGVRFINDAYNANPDSTRASLETFGELAADAPRGVVILGDMLELGDEAEALHRDLAPAICELHTRRPLERLELVGPLAASIAEALPGSLRARCRQWAELDDEARTAVHAALEPGDVVLLKASRGARLERLLEPGEACSTTC